ncbi:ANTH domain-containing protein [Haematococcus lacustris]
MDPSEKQAAKYKSKNLMGYIQDKVDVGITKLRSDEGVDLDVAVVKATLQDEVAPKDKHVRTLKVACSGSAPRQQVSYVIHGLAKRLEEKSGWLVTLKTLIVFHRLMREVDPSFQDEIIRYQERTGAHRMLRLDSFADHTTRDTWDYSAWIRVYSVYLDERLGAFKSMRFDPELEAVGAGGGAGGHDGFTAPQARGDSSSKLKSCGASELLDKLPQIQKLLSRLIACVPEGAAQHNDIVLQSCAMVMREVRATYRCVCEGVINLADKYFEMERPEALRGLDLYKENSLLNDRLNAFFSNINHVPTLRGVVQMPSLQALPPDFLTTMEEYVRDAPRPAAAPGRQAALRQSGQSLPGQGQASPDAKPTHSLGGSDAGLPPTLASPLQGVLRVGPPTGSPGASLAPVPTPAPQPSVDLLGDDFSSPAISSPRPPQPQQQQPQQQQQQMPLQQQQQQQPFQPQQQQPQQQQQYASPTQPQHQYASAVPQPHSYPGQQQQASGSPATPGFEAPQPHYQHHAPYAHPMQASYPPAAAPQHQGWGEAAFAAPTAAAGFVDRPAFAAPMAAPPAFNPFAAAPPPMTAHAYPNPPGYGQPASNPNPFGANPNPFDQGSGQAHAFPPAAGPSLVASNPFGVTGPAWGAGAPQGASAWGVAGPAQVQARRTQDPLNDLGVDVLFGKPAGVQPPAPSLRDLKIGAP